MLLGHFQQAPDSTTTQILKLRYKRHFLDQKDFIPHFPLVVQNWAPL